MSTLEPMWRRVRSTPLENGGRVVVLSTLVNDVRVFREEHFSAPDLDGMRSLTAERFWTTDEQRAHRTMAAALAAATAPVERNEP